MEADPSFKGLSIEEGRPVLEGVVPRSMTSDFITAKLQKDGTWKCELSGPMVCWGLGYFWSAGQHIEIMVNPGGASFSIDAPALHSDLPSVVAVAKDHSHAWVVSSGTYGGGTHLVEWTGMRWRERHDVLPELVYPEDLRAITMKPDGHYAAATSYSLLESDGARFVAKPVPEGFAPELLVPTEAQGLWVLGPRRAWRWLDGSWSHVELPFARVHSAWLAPDGELWIAGLSEGQAKTESKSAKGADVASVVRLPLAESTAGSGS